MVSAVLQYEPENGGVESTLGPEFGAAHSLSDPDRLYFTSAPFPDPAHDDRYLSRFEKLTSLGFDVCPNCEEIRPCRCEEEEDPELDETVETMALNLDPETTFHDRIINLILAEEPAKAMKQLRKALENAPEDNRDHVVELADEAYQALMEMGYEDEASELAEFAGNLGINLGAIGKGPSALAAPSGFSGGPAGPSGGAAAGGPGGAGGGPA